MSATHQLPDSFWTTVKLPKRTVNILHCKSGVVKTTRSALPVADSAREKGSKHTTTGQITGI